MNTDPARVGPCHNAQLHGVRDRGVSNGGHSDTQKQQLGIYSDPTPVVTGYEQGNDMYGGGPIPQYESNYAMGPARPARSCGTTAPQRPQPQCRGEYTMVSSHTMVRLSICLPSFPPLMKPSSQHGNLTQYENNQSEAHFAVDPTPNHTMQFPPLPPDASAAPNNQGTFPVWRLNNCWISYAEQDELHVTISLRKIPFT